jgi:hypothetical protein
MSGTPDGLPCPYTLITTGRLLTIGNKGVGVARR